jgi:predicted amidophosphoribosyltransferase
VLRLFGALPTEDRARRMTDRDYLWCALNLALDREEELARLCPACRERAEEELCPVCGAPRGERAVNEGFDWERYEELKGGGDR